MPSVTRSAGFVQQWANGGTTSWASASGNVGTSDDVYNYINPVKSNSLSQSLRHAGFGFTVFDFPAGATVTGYVLRIERRSVSGLATDATVRLAFENGSPTSAGLRGNNKASASAIPSTDTYTTYGSSSDLWAATFTIAEITNGSAFGVDLQYNVRPAGGGPGGPDIYVDHVELTIHYSTVVAHTKSVLATTTPTPRVTKQAGKIRRVTTTPTRRLLKEVGKIRRASTTPVGSMARGLLRGKALLASTTPVPWTARAVGKLVRGSTTPVAAIGRAIARTLLGSTTPAPRVANSVPRALLGQSTPGPSLSTNRTVGVLLQAITPPVAAIGRAVTKTLLYAVAPAVSIVRALPKALQANSKPDPSMDKSNVRNVALLASSTPAPLMRRSYAKVLQAIVGAAASGGARVVAFFTRPRY